MKNLLILLFASSLVMPVIVLSQDYATETALLTAKTAYTNALVADLKADAELKTQQSAEATAQAATAKAAQDKKDTAQKATLDAIVELGKNLPTGSYTANDKGVATPKATELAYVNLTAKAVKLAGELNSYLKGGLIFTDTIPAPNPGFEYALYKALMDDLNAEALRLKVDAGQAQSLGAATVISALPGILNAVAGFFRADITEATIEGNIPRSAAVSAFIGALPVGSKCYESVEAYAFAQIKDINKTPLAGRIKGFSTILANIAKKVEGIDVSNEEEAFTKASNDVDETKAQIASLKAHKTLLGELIKNLPTQAATYEPVFKELGDKIVTLQATQRAQEKTLAAAKTLLAKASRERDDCVALGEKITKLFATLRSTEGTPPLFIRLLREEQMKDVTADAVTFVSLAVVASPQSTITEKRFWSQKIYASALIALEYRVADGTRSIVAAGVVPAYDVQRYRPKEVAKAE